MSNSLRTFTSVELSKILEDHKLWRDSDGIHGSRANLSGADLYRAKLAGADLKSVDLYRAKLAGADLKSVDLYRANLYRADLSGADLSGANLSYANLYLANLEGANLYGAKLYGADLKSANLTGANLTGVNLEGAYLYGADLQCANLEGASLYRADLAGANLEGALNVPDFQRCPKEGSFKAFKKVRKGCSHYILELEIPADAERISSTGTKCRASKAQVIRAMRLDGSSVKDQENLVFLSLYAYVGGFSFPYRIGEAVEVLDFNSDMRVECAPGIHFFMEYQEAVDY